MIRDGRVEPPHRAAAVGRQVVHVDRRVGPLHIEASLGVGARRLDGRARHTRVGLEVVVIRQALVHGAVHGTAREVQEPIRVGEVGDLEVRRRGRRLRQLRTFGYVYSWFIFDRWSLGVRHKIGADLTWAAERGLCRRTHT